MITFGSTPLKIGQIIIFSVTINVVNMFVNFIWLEGKHHKSMNGMIGSFTISHKADSWVTIAAGLLKKFSLGPIFPATASPLESAFGKHTPAIRDRVEFFVANNIKPFFHMENMPCY